MILYSEFFNRHVRPCVASRIRKSFIDQWLLAEDLSEYIQLPKFRALSPAEKILLCLSLENTATRVSIAAHMTEEAEEERRKMFVDRDHLFNVCVGLSGTSGDPGEGFGGMASGLDAPIEMDMDVCMRMEGVYLFMYLLPIHFTYMF